MLLLLAENGSDRSFCCLVFTHAVFAAYLHLSCTYLEAVRQKCLIEEHYVVCVTLELLLCLYEGELVKSLCEEQDLWLDHHL